LSIDKLQIQQHIESLVARATSISTLAVLRILHVSHSMCASLVETLKAYDVTLGGYATAKVEASGGPLSTMLDQALEEMFVPCMETPYLDLESKNLVELYGGLLSRFARYHETVLKAKPNSLLDRVVNSMSTSAGSPASTAHAAAAAISKYGVPGACKDVNGDHEPTARNPATCGHAVTCPRVCAVGYTRA
jgi:hypothetical protein